VVVEVWNSYPTRASTSATSSSRRPTSMEFNQSLKSHIPSLPSLGHIGEVFLIFIMSPNSMKYQTRTVISTQWSYS